MGMITKNTAARVEAAKKSVGSALAMFAKAASQIEAANVEIKSAMAADMDAILELENNVQKAQVELNSNEAVLAKLKDFIPTNI